MKDQDIPRGRGFPAADRRTSRAEHRAWRRMMGDMRDVVFWTWPEEFLAAHIPDGWRRIERDHPVRPKKVRVTLLLDPEVVRFYRGAGRGYQARINAILAVYMNLRQSKAIEGAEDRGIDGEPV